MNLSSLDNSDYSLFDLADSTKLLDRFIRDLSLEDSKSVLKLVRSQIDAISFQLNQEKESPSNLSQGDYNWNSRARLARKLKLDSAVKLKVHIAKILSATYTFPPINQDKLETENNRLKKKLAKREKHIAHMELERSAIRLCLRERLSEEFLTDLFKEINERVINLKEQESESLTTVDLLH